MLSIDDVEAMKREYRSAVSGAADSGGASLYGVLRQHGRLLDEAEALCRSRDRMLDELKHAVVLPLV